MTAPPTEPDWLVDGLMARGTITMLSGDTSAGKSWVSLALAMAVLDGERTWLGCHVTGPGRVLVIENEMPGYDVEQRLRGFGIRNEHWQRLAYLDKTQAVALDDDTQAQQLRAVVEALAPDLVILDTLFSLAPGLDHNSNGEAARFYRDVLRPLARSTSLLLLQHENKPGEHRGRSEYAATGARAWAHQADRHLTLAATGDREVKREPLDDGRTLVRYALELDSGKTRGPLKPKLSLSLETVEDAHARVISTELRVVGDRQRKQRESLSDRIVAAMRSAPNGTLDYQECKAINGGKDNGSLGRALKDDRIVSVERGVYGLAES